MKEKLIRNSREYKKIIIKKTLFDFCYTFSAGFRKNEALCYLSYEAPYLGPEGGRPCTPTQAVNSIIMSGPCA